MSKTTKYLFYFGALVLVLVLVWLMAADEQKRAGRQKEVEDRAKSTAQTCTLNGADYSHGALVRAGDRILKCDAGKWRPVSQ